MRITSKGQVTIPQHIREAAGFLPGTEVDFVFDADGRVVVVEVDHPSTTTRGERIVANMSGKAGHGISTDELMNLLRGYDEDDEDPGFADTSTAEVA